MTGSDAPNHADYATERGNAIDPEIPMLGKNLEHTMSPYIATIYSATML
jgi:hypothetical protein